MPEAFASLAPLCTPLPPRNSKFEYSKRFSLFAGISYFYQQMFIELKQHKPTELVYYALFPVLRENCTIPVEIRVYTQRRGKPEGLGM